MPDQPPPIPDFTLLRPIGRGAYGEVWLARSVTGVYRAVKIVRRDSFSEERPFEREFAGIKRFEPVSVGQESQVSLLHVGRNDAAGLFYYVMELADDIETGEEIFPERYVPKTLKELRARRKRLPADECLSISLALARALAHLHENGLVHRDIKPSNVIFVHGVPKLADIGLVSAIDTSESFVGTEGFVPPEGPGSASADVFSLGKVIYEISTGLDRNDFPKLPEDLDAVTDRRGLLELNEVVLKACDSDVQRRYASAESMHEDLVLLQAGKSVRRLHVMERRFAFVAKYGVAATIITALAIGGFLWASAQTRQAKQNLQRAERAEAEALTRLHEANLNWVRAHRLTGRTGQRFASLAELAKAAKRTNSLDLRNEAIACLALPDLRPLKQWAKTPYWDSFNFSPSFELYGTNDDRGNVFVRDTETDVMQFQLPTQGVPLATGAASPDERFLATSDMGGRAWIWELNTQTPRPIQFPRDAKFLEFTPDSRAVVVKHVDNTLHFLNATNGVEEKTFPGPAKLSSFRFNQAGDLFWAVAGGQVSVHSAVDGRQLRTIPVPAGISQAAWHPDGRRIALAWLTQFGLWDAETGKQLTTFEGHEALVVGLAFNETGEWLASASWDGTTRLWQTDTSREALRLADSGNGLRFSADGRRLSFKSWDHSRVHLFEFAVPGVAQRFNLPPSARYANNYTAQVVFGPDAGLIAAVDREVICLFQPPRLAPVAQLPAGEGHTAQFQSDGRALVVCGPQGVQRWPITWSGNRAELRLGPPEILEPTRGQRVDGFQLSRSGDWIVAATRKGFLGFNPNQPANVVRPEKAIQPGHLRHLSPDGHLAISFFGDRHEDAQIWNARTGTLVTNLPIPRVRDAAFTPDNRWLACTDTEATTFWRAADWTRHHRIPHRAETPTRHRLTLTPDGRVAAVSVSENEMLLIAVETGEELAALPMDRMLTSLVFSPDGNRLAAASEPGYFRVWDLHRLHDELALLNLNWPGPALPPRLTPTKPLHVTVISNPPPPSGSTTGKAGGP